MGTPSISENNFLRCRNKSTKEMPFNWIPLLSVQEAMEALRTIAGPCILISIFLWLHTDCSVLCFRMIFLTKKFIEDFSLNAAISVFFFIPLLSIQAVIAKISWVHKFPTQTSGPISRSKHVHYRTFLIRSNSRIAGKTGSFPNADN